MSSRYVLKQLYPQKITILSNKVHVFYQFKYDFLLRLYIVLSTKKEYSTKQFYKCKLFAYTCIQVREFCGTAKIFSSMHVSGEQLEQLTGLCAILRFPMEELEDSDDSDSD